MLRKKISFENFLIGRKPITIVVDYNRNHPMLLMLRLFNLFFSIQFFINKYIRKNNKPREKDFVAMQVPYTNKIVSLKKIQEHAQLFEHEKFHRIQCLFHGILYLPEYLYENIRHGYSKNRFEVEAREYQKKCNCHVDDKAVFINEDKLYPPEKIK